MSQADFNEKVMQELVTLTGLPDFPAVEQTLTDKQYNWKDLLEDQWGLHQLEFATSGGEAGDILFIVESAEEILFHCGWKQQWVQR